MDKNKFIATKNIIATNILLGVKLDSGWSRYPCSHSPNVLWQIDERGVFCGGCQDYVYLKLRENLMVKCISCENLTNKKVCNNCIEEEKQCTKKVERELCGQ